MCIGLEKRELTISYREIGNHIVKLVKVAKKGRSGYFDQYEYKLIVDNEVKSTFNTCCNLTYKSFNKLYKDVSENNIDLLIGNFNLFGYR